MRIAPIARLHQKDNTSKLELDRAQIKCRLLWLRLPIGSPYAQTCCWVGPWLALFRAHYSLVTVTAEAFGSATATCCSCCSCCASWRCSELVSSRSLRSCSWHHSVWSRWESGGNAWEGSGGKTDTKTQREQALAALVINVLDVGGLISQPPPILIKVRTTTDGELIQRPNVTPYTNK